MINVDGTSSNSQIKYVNTCHIYVALDLHLVNEPLVGADECDEVDRKHKRPLTFISCSFSPYIEH